MTLMRLTVLWAFLLPFGGAFAETFGIEHYAKLSRVSDVRISPRGKTAVFIVSRPNYVDNVWESELHSIDLETKRVRALTNQRKSVASLRWSPDGTEIAFMAKVSAEQQVFVLDFQGGEARQITHSPTGVQSFTWSADGKSFAFVASDEAPKREKFDDSFYVNNNDYLTQKAPLPAHLWVIGADGGKARRLTSGSWTVSGGPAWQPGGDRIVFVTLPSPGTRASFSPEMKWVRSTGGEPETIPGAGERKCRNAVFSPDGKQIMAMCPIDGHVKNQDELQAVSVAGGAWQRVSTGVDRQFFGAKAWTADGKAVVATASDRTASGIWTIPLAGSALKWNTAMLTITDFDVAADGSAVMIATSAQRPPELYFVRDAKAKPERLTELHQEIASLELGRMESVFWKSDDGLPLSAVVTYPPNFDAMKKYPVLLHIHGGPWGSSKETFSSRPQLFASRGWIVYEPNYRGSDNMGNQLYVAVYRDHGAGLGRDVMSGLAELKKKPYVDATQIGVSGWSYGGYMTTWLIGHYSGWKAAMAGAAVIDLIEDYNLLDLPLYMRAYGETLSFPKDLELMKEQSPGTYVDQMKTPLLLISDTGDVRVPVVQSYKLYNALKERGQDVRMLLYPVPGHFPADAWRARDIDQKWMEWFVERLK